MIHVSIVLYHNMIQSKSSQGELNRRRNPPFHRQDGGLRERYYALRATMVSAREANNNTEATCEPKL